MTNIQIAIDGPAGSGKSSISKIVAKRLNFTHIDTGAMFRAITYYVLENNISLDNENEYSFLDNINIEYLDNNIFLNGKNVSKEIRTDVVTKNVSAVSKLKVVRDKMIILERKAASSGKILMDGRDIGTVVLPSADVKIFLTASKEERAKRRYAELVSKGVSDISVEMVLEDIIARDLKDSTREIAPLKQADDAILLDTTFLTIEEVCDKIIEIIENKVGFKMEDKDFKMEEIDIKRIRKGQIVTGTVVEVGENVLYLDLQAFTEGCIYLDHYTLDKDIKTFKGLVNLGDEVEVEITKVEEGELSGAIICSRLRLLKEEKFKDIISLVDTKEVITVKVKNEVKNKGYNVTYMGFDFFMPRSLSPRNVKIGDEVKVIINKIDERRKSGVVDAKVVLDEEYAKAKEEALANIKEGDVLKGEVVKILPFAAFVKFGLIQGMLRLPEVSHTFIGKIEDALTLGEEIEVKVIEVKNGKVYLSRKALLKTPFELYVESHKVGETVKGKIINKLPYGLLLEVAPRVKGLLHQSEYSWNPNDNFNNCVNIGDEIEVAISELDLKNERISLSRKALIDNPWSRVDAKVGDICECKIKEFDTKGVIVETLGVDGFIPNPAFLAEGQNGKPSDYNAIGDTVKAMITEIRPKEWVLRLSVRKILVKEERKQFEKYMDESNNDKVTLGDMFKDILK